MLNQNRVRFYLYGIALTKVFGPDLEDHMPLSLIYIPSVTLLVKMAEVDMILNFSQEFLT